MSKLNKNIIAVAIAAAFAVPAAHAVTVSAPAATRTVNQNQFASPSASVTVTSFTVASDASDNYLGRTVGYNVRVTLPDGVTLAAGLTQAAIGEAGGAAEATLVAGTGAAGSNNFTVLVVPNAVTGTVVGEGFVVSGLQIAGTSLANGGTVTATAAVSDPTTALPLASSSGVILRAIQGIDIEFEPTTGANRIDVAFGKRRLVDSPYEVGGGDTALTFDAGDIIIGDAEGVVPWLAAQTGAVATVTLYGTDFSAFRASTGTGNTAAGITVGGATGVISTDGTSVSFANIAVAAASTTLAVTLDPNSVTAIQAQNIRALVSVNPGSQYAAYSEEGALAPLRYNGAELTFYNVNPARNARAQSFIRLSNESNIACPVTLVGRDDAGNAGASPVTLSIPVGASATVNSEVLENGSANTVGAFGPGTGRWIVTATGECGTLTGSALNRNLEDGTVTNLTHVERSDQTAQP